MLTRFSLTHEGDDPFGAFVEWGSAADEKVYGGL